MTDPDYVRLNRTPFSERWEVVKVNDAGVITWRKPIHPDDAAVLEGSHAIRERLVSLCDERDEESFGGGKWSENGALRTTEVRAILRGEDPS